MSKKNPSTINPSSYVLQQSNLLISTDVQLALNTSYILQENILIQMYDDYLTCQMKTRMNKPCVICPLWQGLKHWMDEDIDICK